MKVLGLLLALLLAVPLLAATTNVDLIGSSFSPNSITVQVGDTVHWANGPSGGFHNVVADGSSFNSGAAANPSWTYDFVFNSPGAFAYYCSIHGSAGGGGMSGVVNVVAGPAGTPTATPTTPTPGTAPIQFFDKAPDLVLAPNPQKLGAQVCLYSSLLPAESHWDIYNTNVERVASLHFGGSALQCWDTSGVGPGLYYVHVKWVLPDGRVKEVKQKVVLWR